MPTPHEWMAQADLLEALRALQSDPATANVAVQAERMLHDLEAHQVELQMQNRELREAQQLLEESRSRYADLFDMAPVGYCTLDREGRMREVNLAAANMLGVDRDALHGRHFHSLLSISEGARVRQHLDECFAQGRNFSTEATLSMTPRGPLVVHMVSTPVFGLGGAIVATRTTLTDISSLKRSEQLQRFISEASEALSSSLEYEKTLATVVRLAVPLLADICFVDLVDEAGHIRRLDAAFADPEKAALAPAIKSAVQGSDSARMQAQVLRGLSPRLLVDRAAAALTTADIGDAGPARSAMFIPLIARELPFGVLTLIMAESERVYSPNDLSLALDIARRAAMAIDNARLYRLAQRASGARDEVLAVVAHDLKNPLASVTLGASTLLHGAPESDRRMGRKQLESIRRGAERMARLIDDLVDVSSLEAGHLSFAKRELPVAELLEDAAELLQPQAQRQGISIAVGPVQPGLKVVCDRERTLQVLSNLLGNAIKFAPHRGHVTLRAERDEQSVRFAVSDDGPGIDETHLHKVFERYWQAQEGSHKGSGLGLYISKGIVEAQGGRIWATSAVGSGSTFHFALPLRERQAPAAERGRATGGAAAPSPVSGVRKSSPRAGSDAGALVMIVDDDAELRDALGDILEHKGYEVAQAADGREAFDYLHRGTSTPALILLDLQMPVMDGVTLVRQLREDPTSAAIPIVLVSSQHDVAAQAESLGVAAYLRKPVQLGRLLDTVESCRH